MQLWKATAMITIGLAWLGAAGCATPSLQQGRIGNLEYALVEVRDRQDRMAEEFRERLESMERSLLQQERFLQDAFAFLETLKSLDPLEVQAEACSRTGPDRTPAEPLTEADDALLTPAPAISSQPVPRRTNDLEDRPAPDMTPDPGPDPAPDPRPDTAPDSGPDTAFVQSSAQTAPRQLPGRSPGPAPAPKSDSSEAKDLYDQALARYFNGDYIQARSDFLVFQERFPGHSLMPNALYWQAETHYAQKQFAQAILVFKELSRRFPDSAKAPDALLKAGFAYEQLGDYPNARFHLQIVLNDHPDTPAARLAMERLPLLSSSRS